MSLAIFDLDNTLIAGDSDHSWGEFLVEQGIVDAESFKQANDEFYEDYRLGQLNIDRYLSFALAPLATLSANQINKLHARFMREKIAPLMLPKAAALIHQHRQAGDDLLVITATNRVVTAPIVKTLGINNLIASEAEKIDGRYTGKPTGIPSYADGKVRRLKEWLSETGHNMDRAYFYSDSHMDLPLLEFVHHPVAVDPSPQLADIATKRGWKQISLRDETPCLTAG